ncbi:MAG: hypothetical protein OXR66_00205 [Candidatus Woesearchaeota archaeon]|nr:hypothetical protein [Candidatus Woesearchaeota archaeon]
MKQTALLILAVIALQLATAAPVSDESALDASLLYYQPVPAQPGDQLDLWIQVDNNGGKASGAGTLTIVESGIFQLESESDRVSRFLTIPAQESFLVQTKVRVSKSANEGTNYLTVRVQEDNENSYVERRLSIPVKGTTSTLSITRAETDPPEILPGQDATLLVHVQNIGQTKVRNLDITLDFAGLSFAPVSSSNSKTIASLRGGESEIFTFDIVSYPDAMPQAYQLPVTLDYDDEEGNAKEQNETIGVVVGATPELLVYFESIELTGDEKEGIVILKFVNKGLAEIKLLEMEVLQNDDVKVTSESPVIYVGNIDEDDYESAELKLLVSGDTTVPLRVAYKDALNRAYEERVELPLTLQSENGRSNGSALKYVVILLVLGGLGYWFWKRKK